MNNNEHPPVVQTPDGRVQGQHEQGLLAFRGLPYAKPPQRFLPPAPPEPWSGIRLADSYGPMAVQSADPAAWSSESEDCLTLNIWTPGLEHPLRPVLFYIHGGGFTGGTGGDDIYAGSSFARDGDVVVVTANYRLGVFGFLDVSEWLGEAYRSSGNNGLLDLIQALRWVQANIACFGGDPHRVTIMGQSAGAKAVGGLLYAPAAEGLFQQAIAISGSVQAIRDQATATKLTRSYLDTLALPEQELCRLAELPAATLIQSQHAWVRDTSGIHLFGPVIDGRTIVEPPLGGLKQRATMPALLIGTNRHEAAGFIAADEGLRQPTAELLHRMFGLNAAAVAATYTRRSGRSLAEPVDAASWEETLTDHMYRLGALRTAEAWSQAGAPVWLYRFDRPGPLGKASHAEEFDFVWNNQHVPADEEELACSVHQTWTSFIHHGSPAAALPAWPAYQAGGGQLQVFNHTCRIEPLAPFENHESPLFPVPVIRL